MWAVIQKFQCKPTNPIYSSPDKTIFPSTHIYFELCFCTRHDSFRKKGSFLFLTWAEPSPGRVSSSLVSCKMSSFIMSYCPSKKTMLKLYLTSTAIDPFALKSHCRLGLVNTNLLAKLHKSRKGKQINSIGNICNRRFLHISLLCFHFVWIP